MATEANPGAQDMSEGSASSRRLRPLEDLFRAGTVGDLSDGELLDRFLHDRDAVGEAAFVALVERHGPMVLRVCRETLNDLHAAEDAVQATFLVLARQAGTIRKRTSVSSWLFGVARRTAARIRMEEARRRRYESRSAERSSAPIAAWREPGDPDPYPELHAEIKRLPENERLPVVLCYFEGLSHEQAASRLRWPVGTVKTRLTRARERLRSRLERRGRPFLLVTPTGPLGPGIPAELPERLVQTIARAACRYAMGGIPGGAVSSAVLAVTQGVMRTMMINELRTAAVVSGLALLGLGALVAAQQATGKGRAGQSDATVAETNFAPSTLRLQGTTDYDPATVTTVRLPFDSRVDKVLVDLGSRVKRGDALLEVYSTDLAAAKSDYEVAVSQWKHDTRVHDYKKPLIENNSLPRRELIEIEDSLAQSRLKMRLAKDKLLVYGLTEKEIDDAVFVQPEDGVQKARMTLRSRVDGVVIKRDVVEGNFYDSKDTLLTIAWLDHLWVRASVHEQDAPRVKLGQDLSVIFPFSKGRLTAKVQYIDPRVDPETHSVKLRATIPNPDGRYKSGAYVRVELETEEQHDGVNQPRVAGEEPLGATTNDRLSALERKLDRLLGDNEERSSNAKILERLDNLERKLDQLLHAQKGKSP
jgi:RNA polymerase sigma factor (sigma-70 family)